MGFRMYKSVRLGKGVRLNLSKSGVGMSVGGKNLRYSVHSSGRRSASASLPGTGLSYRTTRGGGERSGSASSRRSTSQATGQPQLPVVTFPKAGLLAPKDEKAFVKGVTAYMQSNYQAALSSLQESKERDPTGKHVGEEFFAALSLIALQRYEQASKLLEEVVASPVEIPDPMMRKYGIGGVTEVAITPAVLARLPINTLGAALLLAEVYQATDRSEQAIKMLESLGAITPDPLFALSLADLYGELERWDDVLRVSEGFSANEDDATCQLLVFRARALREQNLNEAALQILKEALKSKKRSADIINQARYQRALTYEALGRAAKSRQELEKIYAAAPRFADVASRLGMAPQGR